MNTDGGTNPSPAIVRAIHDKCDLLFFLTDGEMLESGEDIARLNVDQIVIHTISIGADTHNLRDVARLNGGQYRFVERP